jgi:integrase
MCGLFSHAIRHEWASKNPIKAVRTSAKRQRITDILTPEEFQAAVPELKQRELVMVLLAGSTALRRGEWIGLYWRDIDFILQQANVTHAIWRNVEGDTKTEASHKPVPLHPIVIDVLQQWRTTSLYKSHDDLVFPSIRKNGMQPLSPDMILRDHVRPALERVGITKQIGWHSFRHGMATMLRVVGVDLKVAQEILRHANSRITQDVYQQTVGDEKRAAQSLSFQRLLGGAVFQHPLAPSEGVENI